MAKKLNIAVVGGGFMGKAHSNAWKTAGKFFEMEYEPVLKVSVDSNEAVKGFADHWGYEEFSTKFDEVIARKDIDVVDICTPTFTHKELAVKAANAGKHVFCEKPCAITYAEAKEMLEAAKKAGVVHYLNHNYRRVPAVAYAKQMIEEGKLGTIYHWKGAYLQDWIMDPNFPLTWHLKEETAGGGPLWDLNSHSMDLARFLVGEVESLSAINKTFITERPIPGGSTSTFGAVEKETTSKGKVTVDDASFLLLNFENGALGSQEGSRFACGRKNYNTFEIYGSKGAVSFNFERMNELQYLDFTQKATEQGFKTIMVTEYAHPYCKAWWAPGHIIGYENTFVHAVADFTDAVTKGTSVSPNFEDGVKNIQILEAAKLSSAKKQVVKVSDIK